MSAQEAGHMFDQDKAYKIRWDVPIHANGTIVNMVADGEGCAKDGRLFVVLGSTVAPRASTLPSS
jgi:hypothetical protein